MSLVNESHLNLPGIGNDQPLVVRWFAQFVSYLFHPLFIPVYITCFLLYVHPFLFAGYNTGMKMKLVATVFVNLTFLPAITVFLCWRLKFINNVYMNTQKERIIPLAAAMIFYFWCWFVLKNFTEIPVVYRQFLLGSFITIIGAWLANIVFKVSLHALAMGGMFCFMMLLIFNTEGGSAQYFALAVFVAGVVCSSRMLLLAHRSFDVYAGFFIGIFSQLAALIV